MEATYRFCCLTLLLALTVLAFTGYCQSGEFVSGGPALMEHLMIAPEPGAPDTASVCSLLSAKGYGIVGAEHIDLASVFIAYKLGNTILLVRRAEDRKDIRVVVNAAIEIRKVGSACDTLIRLWTNGDLSIQAPFAEDIQSLGGIEAAYLLSRDSIDTVGLSAAIAADLRERQYPIRIGIQQLTAGDGCRSLYTRLDHAGPPGPPPPVKPEDRVLVFTARHYPDSIIDSIRLANSIARVWRGTPDALKLQGFKIVPAAPARALLGLLDSIPDSLCADAATADTGVQCEIHYDERRIRCPNYLNQAPHMPLRAFVTQLYGTLGMQP
ncbi:MAG: hypothetical protein GF331_01060 [Chitinivibrionales bacterium]|nr:hypothetical protein [Chitinivibrionales bacterium]